MSDLYGIYLHIPYCRAKCRYCDFYSAPGARGVPQAYVSALLRELAKNDRGFPLGLGLDVLSHGALLSAIRNVIFANILQIVKIVRFFRGAFGAA